MLIKMLNIVLFGAPGCGKVPSRNFWRSVSLSVTSQQEISFVSRSLLRPSSVCRCRLASSVVSLLPISS